jgi:hypothetical protein
MPRPTIGRPLPFTVLVNGHGPSEMFTVIAGEPLKIDVSLTVPVGATITALWLGVCGGTLGTTDTGPVGMDPILKRTRNVLEPGPHTFRLTWTVPAELNHASDQWLTAAYAGQLPVAGLAGSQDRFTDGSVTTPIARLAISS